MLKLILGFKFVSLRDRRPHRSMSEAVKALLVCCLLQGISCQDWTVFMPGMLRGLGGSCVKIPCRFTLPSDWDTHLDDSCKAIWKRGSRMQVFDSSLTGEDANSNILQGNLIGNLRDKDCTTIFHNLPFQHYNHYYFRLQCNNQLRFNFEPSVLIYTTDSLPKPSLTPSSLEVEEGTPLRLICFAVAPCPILPPAITWMPSLGDTEETLFATSVTSVLTFTASYHHHQQTISCAALYKRQAGYTDLSYESSMTISVLYPPNHTSVKGPGPVKEGNWMTLTCITDANPAADSYAWYKVDGDQVTAMGSKRWLTTRASVEQNRFYCTVSNRIGTQNSSVTQIDVGFAPKQTSISADPAGAVLEGSSVTLTCSSRAKPNVTSYAWYRDDDDDESAESGSTLVFTRVDPSHAGAYKCEARNEFGAEESPTVRLDVHYPPKNTSVVVDPSGPLLAGSSVTLTCWTAANPPAETFTWYRADGEKEEMVGYESNFTFNVAKLSEDKYRCEAANVYGGKDSEPVSINVTFAPEVLASSGCISLPSEIRCTCDSHGNPPPSLEWELAGMRVNHSETDLLTREEPLGSTGMRSIITLGRVDEDAPSIVCVSTNSLGSDSLWLNVSLSDYQTVIGSAVGTLLVLLLLLCVPLQLFIYRKRRWCRAPDKELVDSSDRLASDGVENCMAMGTAVYLQPNSLQVDVIYGNASILEEDTLHYADVDFAKLQAESEREPGGVEIRGLSSRTAEYAEIRLHAERGSRGEETDEEAAADTRDRR